MLTGGSDIRWFRPTSCSIHNSGRQEPFWPSSGISPHKKWGKFRWTAGKEKGVGFRLHNHSPSSSFSRHEDRERRRGNRAGGCRRKGKCPGERTDSPGHYCVGIHAGIGCCQGLVGTGTDALPSVAATRRKEGSAPLVECNRHPGRRHAAQGVQKTGAFKGRTVKFQVPCPRQL